MHIALDYLGLTSFLLLAAGWLSHLFAMLSYITHIKKKKVSFLWYYRNRTSKFRRSIITALALGFITYVYFYPPALDIAIDDDRKMLAIYLLSIYMTGAGSSIIVDVIGNVMNVQASGNHHHHEETGETVFLDEETRKQILDSQQNKE